MRMTVVSSCSAGNCYVLQGRYSALIIECGVAPERVMKAVPGLRWSTVAGCLVTHEHGDHAGYMERFMKLGLDVYASAGTFQVKNLVASRRAKKLESMKPKVVGEFYIWPFGVNHDAREPMGFIIEHRECGKILFVTDTRFVSYNFRSQKVDHIMVEANYDDSIVDARVQEGDIVLSQAARIKGAHMSIRHTCEFLRANETGNLKTVTLLHLSSDNANAERFKTLADDSVIFAKVNVARPGLVVEMNKNEF